MLPFSKKDDVVGGEGWGLIGERLEDENCGKRAHGHEGIPYRLLIGADCSNRGLSSCTEALL